MYVRFGSRLNMIHDSSQSNSIFCVMERFVTITEVFVACDYPRAAVERTRRPRLVVPDRETAAAGTNGHCAVDRDRRRATQR